MKTFTTLNTASKITNKDKSKTVEVLKVKKDGTQRIFFQPTFEGKAIGRTLWARLRHAEIVGKEFLNRN